MIFFDLEDAIIERLEAKLAVLDPKPKIYPAADLENAKEKSQAAAAVFVAYNGISGVDQLQGAPHIVTLTNEFIIWAVAKSASRHGSQQGTREKVDPIIEGVIKALAGWKPTKELPALGLVPTPAPGYDEGFGYFPLVFHIKRQVRGDIN